MYHTIFENTEVVLVLLAFIFLFIYTIQRYPIYFLLLRYFRNKPDEKYLPSLSVVITTHNCNTVNREYIEKIVTQDYPHFEVIVVDTDSSGQNTELLKLLEQRYVNLSHTFIPASCRGLSAGKLAITLGARRAQNEWIVLTEADCFPVTSDWLKGIGQACASDKDLVIGFTGYEQPTTFFEKRIKADRFVESLRQIHSVGWRNRRKATGGTLGNLAFRRSKFLEQKGFYDNLLFLGGEELFLVKDIASRGRCAVVCDRKTHVIQEMPSIPHLWNQHKISLSNASSYMSLKFHFERIWWAIGTIANLCWTITIVYLVYQLLMSDYLIPAICVLLIWFFQQLMDQYILSVSSSRLGQKNSHWAMYLNKWMHPFGELYYKMTALKHRRDLKRGF